MAGRFSAGAVARTCPAALRKVPSLGVHTSTRSDTWNGRSVNGASEAPFIAGPLCGFAAPHTRMTLPCASAAWTPCQCSDGALWTSRVCTYWA